jgi:nanoRNase/pAp phosphatase (c-di-AMP/oligoRNAs hydrolase)
MNVKRTTRSSRLLGVLSGFQRVLIITHDNPDPDAIASGWAIRWLIEAKLGIQARVYAGGGIVRAENRHMMHLLRPPIELVDTIDVTEDSAAILVDCEYAADNHLLAKSSARPVAVIDHHTIRGRLQRLAFRDIRPNVAAAASIVSSYLREQDLQLEKNLATALLYAIRTETRGGESRHSRLDRQTVAWLSDIADPTRLAEIEHAPLPRAYFSDLVLALQTTFCYDGAALCFLPQAQGPEIIGEVADLLVRCEGIHQVLCAAGVGEDLFLSVRTENNLDDAAQLVRKTIAGLGQGGGHQHRAGGKIVRRNCGLTGEDLLDELRNRWLNACHVDRQRGTRLVPKREIVKNL